MSPEPLDYQTPRSLNPLVNKCPSCGGGELVEGSLVGGNVRFMPKRVKSFWTFTNGVRTLTYACLSCGTLTLVIDPADLRRLIAPDPSEDPAAP